MNYMNAREFLRGGANQIKEPTIVVKHGRPWLTVFPHGMEPKQDTKPNTVQHGSSR